MKSILLIRGFRGCERFIDYYLKIHSLSEEIFLVKGELVGCVGAVCEPVAPPEQNNISF